MKNSYFRVTDMLADLKDMDQLFDGRKTIFLSLPDDEPAIELLGKYLSVSEWVGEDCNVVSPVLAAFVYDKDGRPKYSGKQIGAMVRDLIVKCDEFWVLLDRLSPNIVSEIYHAAKMGKRVYGLSYLKEGEDE